jgi:predicted CoA-binding protein
VRVTIEDDSQLLEILTSSRTVATVGVSSNPEKPSFGIFAYLADQGYNMIPVNPGTPTIQGRSTYPDLASIPEPVDVVQVFRKPEDVPAVVSEAIKIRAKVVWMQEQVVNDEAARAAEAAGLKVVMNRCMRKTHIRLLGGRSRS